MAKVIIMPKLGFTQEEGNLMGWHKKVGDTVRKGEPSSTCTPTKAS